MIIPEEMKDIALLQNLGEQYLNRLAKMANLKEYEENADIFLQGQGSPSIYFILRGRVGLHVDQSGGTSVEIAELGPGELLGWSPALGRPVMTATARAQTRCRLAALDAHEILELCERDPRFGVAFLRQVALVVSERLGSTRRNLARAMSHRPVMAIAAEGSD